MANQIKALFGTTVTPTFTGSSVANGAGRIAAEIDNSSTRATRGLVGVRYKTGAVAPTASTVVKYYFIRNTASIQSGRGGTALGIVDAAVSVEPVNAECIGAIVLTASATTTFDEVFVVQDPGPKGSVVMWNASGQTSDTTAGNFLIEWTPIVDEVQ